MLGCRVLIGETNLKSSKPDNQAPLAISNVGGSDTSPGVSPVFTRGSIPGKC
jgi:hypothetical protein